MSQTPRDSRPSRSAVGGFLNINKDAGMTSMDVIRRVRRITGIRKAGHGGTLDPDATGVLPVCLGRATRFIDRFVEDRKVYLMAGVLGASTDTYDASGTVTEEAEYAGIRREDMEECLGQFTGELEQVPPMYSAVKHEGVRLYKLARSGEEVEREPRRVTVYRLELQEFDPPRFILRVECGRGFYARSLAHDLGRELGTASHLESLVRERVGRFSVDDAITVDDLAQEAEAGDWGSWMYPVDLALDRLPAVVLDPAEEEAVRHGQAVMIGAVDAGLSAQGGSRDDPETHVRAYSREGEFVALMGLEPVLGRLRPVRVITPL